MSKYDELDVVCICPKCGVEHVVKMLWIGGCKPRKYCPEHKKLSHSDCELCEYPTFWSSGRARQLPADQGEIGY
jgi:hypothetical protein